MKIKYFDIGNAKLYILLNDAKGKDYALRLCKACGYKFYPNALKVGKTIVCDSFSGYLQREEIIKKDSVCTVNKSLYESLDLPFADNKLFDYGSKPEGQIEKEIKESIKDKKLVFIAGRGIGNRANYERLKALASKLGAAVGCSRPVAMNGWESYDNFVGISGNILEAETVVTFGVSGAGPFIKGIENCKKIIAINSDKNALIFKQADYAIVDDCMNVISYLEKI